MASVSASHLILFIASVLVAASVAGTITTTVQDLSNAITDEGVDVTNEVRTDIEIISDSGAPVFDRGGNGNVTLLIKNTGTRRLPADTTGIDVLLDGRLQADITLTVVDSEDPEVWSPGDVAELQISAPGLESGDHRVQVTVRGDEEVFRFNT